MRIAVTIGDWGLPARRLERQTAEVLLNSAKRELARVTALLEQGIISRADYDRAKIALNAAA